MKLVMTLLARDEADVVESWLAFHLNAGATRDRDGQPLRGRHDRRARAVRARGSRPPDPRAGEDLRQDEWVTRWPAWADEFAADWVINSDADEFWWPRGASLSEMLAAVPERYGTVSGFLRTFVPRPGDGDFAERMTVASPRSRRSTTPPRCTSRSGRSCTAHTPRSASPGKPRVVDSPFAPLRGWFPIEVFHFPIRTFEQFEHKTELQRHAFEKYVDRPPTGYHARMFEAMTEGGWPSTTIARRLGRGGSSGGRRGRLVVDTRLRDALRLLRAPDGGYLYPADAPALAFPTPTLVEDADYAVEAAVLGEADVVRLQRRLDTLERRLASIELRLPNRVYRKASAAQSACSAKRVVVR